MFPRNPENEALRLPQPVRGAAPPRGPTDAELLGMGALVCVYTFTCAVCMQVYASTVRACARVQRVTAGARVCRCAVAPIFQAEKARCHSIRRPSGVP